MKQMCPEKPRSQGREALGEEGGMGGSVSIPGCFPGPAPALRHHQHFSAEKEGVLASA